VCLELAITKLCERIIIIIIIHYFLNFNLSATEKNKRGSMNESKFLSLISFHYFQQASNLDNVQDYYAILVFI